MSSVDSDEYPSRSWKWTISDLEIRLLRSLGKLCTTLPLFIKVFNTHYCDFSVKFVTVYIMSVLTNYILTIQTKFKWMDGRGYKNLLLSYENWLINILYSPWEQNRTTLYWETIMVHIRFYQHKIYISFCNTTSLLTLLYVWVSSMLACGKN